MANVFIRQNYRIYPTTEQETILNQWIGAGRYIWNKMLELNKAQYEVDKKFIFGYQLAAKLPIMKREEGTSWLKDVPSQVLQCKCYDLDAAIKRCIKQKFGFPHFKSKQQDMSGIQFPQGYHLNGNRLNLPKMKGLKIKFHRELLGQTKSLHIKKNKAGQWFASFVVEVQEVEVLQINTDVVGIYLGLKEFLITSDAEIIKNPRLGKKQQNKVVKLQRKHSKKQKGSKNKEKARKQLAKCHLKVANQRTDFIKKTANSIAKNYGVVAIEDLNVKGLVRNHKLAKAIHDVSWSMFTTELKWQMKKMGGQVVEIGRFFPSSKICSCCGHKKDKLGLDERTYTCHHCGMSIDRDVNAAINIRNEALRIYTAGMAEINAHGDNDPCDINVDIISQIDEVGILTPLGVK